MNKNLLQRNYELTKENLAVSQKQITFSANGKPLNLSSRIPTT